MMCEDCQEVARSTLVKGIESKMAALIWRADTPQAPSPHVDRSWLNRSDVYRSSTQNANATTLCTLIVDDISLSILTVAMPRDRGLSHL
jgi:hypothetical protein